MGHALRFDTSCTTMKKKILEAIEMFLILWEMEDDVEVTVKKK